MIKTEDDIYLIAAYLTNGAIIKQNGIDRSNPKHIRFEVEGENLDRIEIDWANGKLMGNLVDYHRAIRKVKGLLYDR